MNTNTRVIEFRQSKDEPVYSYTLTERTPVIGDYIYKREYGAFFCVQRILHPYQLSNKSPVIIQTNNPKYESIYKP